MKLTSDEITYIQNVVKTAQTVDIDNIIIEQDTVRAIDDNKTVVLFQNEGVPDMSFGSIGLNRIDVFVSRLDIAKTQPDFTIEAENVDDNKYARSLTMKGKGVKIDYRCANPTTIHAPKQIMDTLEYRVQMNADAVMMLQKGQAAMSAETVTIVSNSKGVSFEIVDINNDLFNYTFTDEVENLLEGDNTNFAHRYPIKTLISLFKQNYESFSIGQRGILNICVHDLNIYVLPQV